MNPPGYCARLTNSARAVSEFGRHRSLSAETSPFTTSSVMENHDYVHGYESVNHILLCFRIVLLASDVLSAHRKDNPEIPSFMSTKRSDTKHSARESPPKSVPIFATPQFIKTPRLKPTTRKAQGPLRPLDNPRQPKRVRRTTFERVLWTHGRKRSTPTL